MAKTEKVTDNRLPFKDTPEYGQAKVAVQRAIGAKLVAVHLGRDLDEIYSDWKEVLSGDGITASKGNLVGEYFLRW